MARSRMNSHMTKKQMKEIKEKLLAEAERIENKLSTELPQMQEYTSNSGRDEVDSANDSILLATDLRFASRETMYLKKIKKTLKKAETEEFGMCEDCGSQISFTRLSARPTSDLCILCKEESEREEFQSARGRVSKSMGQTMTVTGRRL